MRSETDLFAQLHFVVGTNLNLITSLNFTQNNSAHSRPLFNYFALSGLWTPRLGYAVVEESGTWPGLYPT